MAAAAALLRSVAGARSGPALLHGKQQGPADVLVSAGRRHTTMLMAPSPHHRLVHGRRLHSSTSPAASSALPGAGGPAYYIMLFGTAVCVHIWHRDLLLHSAGLGKPTKTGTWLFDKLDKLGYTKKATNQTMHPLENRVKELEATVMDLKAEIAKLKIASESSV